MAELLVREGFENHCIAEGRPDDANAWLVGAACDGAKAYLQRRGLAVTDAADDEREMENSSSTAKRWSPCPHAPGKRCGCGSGYGERMTRSPAELDVSRYYAVQLVAKAGAKLRKVVREMRER